MGPISLGMLMGVVSRNSMGIKWDPCPWGSPEKPTDEVSKCVMVQSRYIGDGHPTFNRNPYNGALFSPLRTWVDEFIPYYMAMSWELIDPIAQIVSTV